MINSALFLDEFPQFATIPTSKITRKIAAKYRTLPVSIWGDSELRDEGCSLLVAHEFALEYRDLMDQAILLINSERGEYNSAHIQIEDYYKATIYGMQFCKLRKSIQTSAAFVV